MVDATLGTTSIDLVIIILAVELCKKVSNSYDQGPFTPDLVFIKDVLTYITNHVEKGETRDPLELDNNDAIKEVVTSNAIVLVQGIK